VSVRESRWGSRALVAALAMGLGACGGAATDGAVGGSVSSQPLAGTIDGKPWTFVAGQTDHFLSQSGSNFFASLYDQAIDSPCAGEPPGTTRRLLLSVPMAVGHYALSLDLNQTFSYDDSTGTPQNDIAISGVLDVTTLTASALQGGIKMAYDANNSVDGQFVLGVCAQ
jgi:hypothetical protein